MAEKVFEKPRKLAKADERESFSSGALELDRWFQRFAYENQRANNATTYVSTQEHEVVGYYSITVAAVEKSDAPSKFDKPSDPKQLPCILLARLAVSLEHQGKGVGAGLLVDALERAAVLSDSVGAKALLIHAKDDSAKAFYEKWADCYELPGNPLHLMIPMKWIRAEFIR